MGLRRNNTRNFIRVHYGGQTETVTLLKRGDDQAEGTVTALTLFCCRRKGITRTGQSIAGDIQSDHRCTWVIPRAELERVGVEYLMNADRIVQTRKGPEQGWTWQPEASTRVEIKLFGNVVNVDCLRINAAGPPGVP